MRLIMGLLVVFVFVAIIGTYVKNQEIKSLKAQAEENRATIEQLQKRPDLPASIYDDSPSKFIEMPFYTIVWYPLTQEDIVKGEKPARLLEDFILPHLVQNLIGGHKKEWPVNNGFLMYIEHLPLSK